MRMVIGGARLWAGCLQAVHNRAGGEEERRGRLVLVPLPPKPAYAGLHLHFPLKTV